MSIRRVMIYDGEAFMRMCAKKVLIDNGFEVSETANGIEVIWESKPDLGLMDITKPTGDDQAAGKHSRTLASASTNY